MTITQWLNPLYTGENPLQAINARAKKIEDKTGVHVLRFHLGNPTALQNEGTNQLLARYFAARGQFPETRGYADVAGQPDILHVIAMAMNKLNRLEGDHKITGENLVGANGGTGALNVAISIAGKVGAESDSFAGRMKVKEPVVLVTEPTYPAWKEIAQRLKVDIETFKLRAEDDYLLNEAIIEQKIAQIIDKDRPIVLIYHYPHNPTGKALSQEEAKQAAGILNRLCEKHPNLLLIQEDLYLATTKKEMGIYTPLPYLKGAAKDQVIWLHSPSKEGHPQDRGAVMGAFNKDIVKHLRGGISFDALGASTPALLATASTLTDIAHGGVDAWTDEAKTSPLRQDNYRFQTADYYQDRLKIVHAGLKEIEAALNVKAQDGDKVSLFAGHGDGMPQGAYYLYPNFSFLKGKPIPTELQQVCSGHTYFQNADDITMALANAHLIGLQPMTVASGTLFENAPDAMTLRISTVDPDICAMHGAVNTLKGLTQKVLGVDLAVKYSPNVQELAKNHPIPQQAQSGWKEFLLQEFPSVPARAIR